jgi:hypothetical protein
MCISMELVTAVLGDHGQRPQEDYGKSIVSTFCFSYKFLFPLFNDICFLPI